MAGKLVQQGEHCAEERHPYQKQAPSREAAALKSYAGQQCDHFKLQLVQNSRPS